MEGKRGVDEPGPVVVVNPAPRLFNSNLTSAKSAISMANAIRVNSAAKNATKDEITGMTLWFANSERKNARNVATVAACKSKKKSHQIKKKKENINSPTG